MAVEKRYQHHEEIAAFANLLRDEGVRSYLEVGSKFGGGLWDVATALPEGSRIVSVDLNRNGAALGDRILKLRGMGYDAHLIAGNSMDPAIVAAVRKLAPFDAVFIDGDHSLAGVTADWTNYGPMARIVGFHDIAWWRSPDWRGTAFIEVPEFWNGLKAGYRHQEFKLCQSGNNNGIGVLWR